MCRTFEMLLGRKRIFWNGKRLSVKVVESQLSVGSTGEGHRVWQVVPRCYNVLNISQY